MNNDKIKLSICIVTYNHEKYVCECVDSILGQNMNFKTEILIGDDKSTDSTASILKENYYDRAELILRETNLGLCSNLLDLYKRAQGEYIYTISGDDYLSDMNALQKLVDFLDNNPKYASVSYWNSIYNTAQQKLFQFGKETAPYEYTFLEFMQGKEQPCYRGLIRNVFDPDSSEFDYLAEGARNNEEVKAWFCLLSQGPIYIIHEYFYVYRYVNDPSASNYCSNHNEFQIFKDYYTDINILENHFNSKYNFEPLKLTWTNRYSKKCCKGIKNTMTFYKYIGFKMFIRLTKFKMMLRFSNNQIPSEWSNESYFIK